ncbi:MAG: acyltransferase [Eubacterium sp.]|nr:acyltransferase [Eubacterium sp.]
MTDEEFEELFENYIEKKRDRMKAEYNRVLPTGELIFNRFDKAGYLDAGEGTSIYDTSVIMGDVKIGSHVWIGPYTLLEGANSELTIGDYVTVNTGAVIYTHDSTKHFLSPGGAEPFKKGRVSIGDHTVIGTYAMISCGISIGKHCVVGAHSYVNRDIPDHSIAIGRPAKIVGRVEIDEDGHVELVYDK